MVRGVKNIPFTGAIPKSFSEIDAGGDIGGPIIKDKLWFFGAFNPQRRRNYYLTQTFHAPVQNKVTIPFYAGKITYALNGKNTITASTFGDFTKVEGFLATGALTNVNGFGESVDAFTGRQQTGGHNYAFRLNSTLKSNFIAEFSGGLHFQRANTFPTNSSVPAITDNFAVLRGGAVLPGTQTGVYSGFSSNAEVAACGAGAGPCPPNLGRTGHLCFVGGRGGAVRRALERVLGV